jgi:predicted RNase H-like HicB family nuclease
MVGRTLLRRDMKKVTVIVERASDGSFWCHTEESIAGVGLNACGSTVAEAKKDLSECLALAREDAEEEGKKFPELEFEYKYDLQSFFNYFSFLNVSEIAKRSGVNASLMRQYNRGIKKAGEKTYDRLSKCVSDITRELAAATF